MQSKFSALKTEFTFAGFSWPRYVVTLPSGDLQKRLQRVKSGSATSGYYHAPKPVKGAHPGRGFYLGDAGQMFTRWNWADDVINLRHTGYFCAPWGDDSEKMRGLVVRLARSRGFLAGWSMGEGMASEVDGYIYATEEDAARAADSMAEHAAENEREYQAEESAKLDAEEARAELHRINKTALPLFAELRKGLTYAAPVCDAIRARIESLIAERAEQFRIIAEREENFWSAVEY